MCFLRWKRQLRGLVCDVTPSAASCSCLPQIQGGGGEVTLALSKVASWPRHGEHEAIPLREEAYLAAACQVFWDAT
jgi:hypothetical protein